MIGYDFLGKLQIMHKTERTSKISCSALVKILYITLLKDDFLKNIYAAMKIPDKNLNYICYLNNIF